MNAIRSHIDYSTYYLHKGLSRRDSDEFGELLPLSSMTDALQVCRYLSYLLIDIEINLLIRNNFCYQETQLFYNSLFLLDSFWFIWSV